jgi:anthranilate phosphoribosyltransferase
MSQIMAGDATPVQVAGLAVALRAKGETPSELAGLVEAMLTAATPVDLPEEVRAGAVDVVGTGGDRANTVNISTMAAIVVAAAGVTVVKHGNRSASSATGTADLLEHFGIPLDLGPAGVARTVADAGIGFCFAARFHPGMRHAAVTRRELAVPTFFNMLGPLTNPARPRSGAVGCFDLRMAPVMAEVFARRGDSVIVMRGEDGLDEFTTAAPTRLWIARDGKVEETLVDATDLGVPRSTPGALRGDDVAFNAAAAHRMFAGEAGPVRDAVLLNAAAAFTAQAGFPGPFAEDMRAGIARAAETVDSGAATALLTRWVECARAARAGEG